jgi:hypothetical protein
VETIRKVRLAYHRDAKSIRQIARDFHMSRNTVKRVVRSGETEFQYVRKSQPRPSPSGAPYSRSLDPASSAMLIRNQATARGWPLSTSGSRMCVLGTDLTGVGQFWMPKVGQFSTPIDKREMRFPSPDVDPPSVVRFVNFTVSGHTT